MEPKQEKLACIKTEEKLKLCKTTKAMVGCGRMLPLDKFYPTRSQCKECSKLYTKTEREDLKKSMMSAQQLNNLESELEQLKLNDKGQKDEILYLREEIENLKSQLKHLTDHLNYLKNSNDVSVLPLDAMSTLKVAPTLEIPSKKNYLDI